MTCKGGARSAQYRSGRSLPVIILAVSLFLWLGWQYQSVIDGYVPELKPFFVFFGALFFFQFIVAAFARPFELRHKNDDLSHLKPVVVIPVYNESRSALRECIRSLFAQTTLPTEIHVVDDGSKEDYSNVKKWYLAEAKKQGIHASWERQVNLGKRHAHDNAFSSIKTTENVIVVTVDSDGILDPRAIEEGLKPFIDPRVKSVAGIVVASNAQRNLLSRITDMIFVSGQQLIDRAAMSQFGNVLVNSGGLAFYRSSVIKVAKKHGYTTETFFGRPISFSDDSYLTLFSLLQGRAVQQQSSIVFADMPISLSHHIRQQLRWNRGSFIRSWWRIRHLDTNSYGWLRQIAGYVVFFSMVTILLQIFILIPLSTGKLPPIELFFIPLLLGLVQYSRYFAIRRSDMSVASQVLSYLLTPLAILWSAIVLRFVRLYSFITCYKTGWNTRSSVEIVHANDL